MSTDNIIKQEIDEPGMDVDKINNIKICSSNVGGMSTVTAPECVYIKQEIQQDADQELNTENIITIKSETDIDEYNIFFPEPTEIDNDVSSIKLEPEQHSAVDIIVEIDPLGENSCADTGEFSEYIDSEKQVKCGDNPVEGLNCGEHALLQTHSSVFSNKKSKTHLRIHTGDKPFECTICYKKFSHNSSFIKHSWIHSADTPYVCTQCNKKFSQSSDLRRHLRIHSGEKPYECDVCNRKFTQYSNLVTHKRTHTNEKPYDCTVCNKKFSESSSLVKHSRIHTGEKPYECVVCNKKFSQSSNLLKHSRTHSR